MRPEGFLYYLTVAKRMLELPAVPVLACEPLMWACFTAGCSSPHFLFREWMTGDSLCVKIIPRCVKQQTGDKMASHQWFADFTLDLNGLIEDFHPEHYTFGIHFISAANATVVPADAITGFDVWSQDHDGPGPLNAQFLGNGKFKISGKFFLSSSSGNALSPVGTRFIISRIVICAITRTLEYELGRDFDQNHFPQLVYTGLPDPDAVKFVQATAPGLVVDNVRTFTV